MRPILLRLLFLALPLAVVAGCTSGGQPRGCEGNTDYLEAVDRPPLRLPPDIVPTERMKPLEIPAADPNPNTLDPVPACLDQPPRFFARKGAVADPAEDVVRAWAAAWAARKPDVVLQAYSAAFQPPDGGDSGPYLDQRRTQVTSGPVPEPKLEDVTVATAGADRRVVTFVQRFGDGALRKELTLAREPAGWRIVSERNLEVL